MLVIQISLWSHTDSIVQCLAIINDIVPFLIKIEKKCYESIYGENILIRPNLNDLLVADLIIETLQRATFEKPGRSNDADHVYCRLFHLFKVLGAQWTLRTIGLISMNDLKATCRQAWQACLRRWPGPSSSPFSWPALLLRTVLRRSCSMKPFLMTSSGDRPRLPIRYITQTFFHKK